MSKRTVIGAVLTLFAASNVALAQYAGAPAAQQTQASASSRSDAKEFQGLQRAAQRLRESIQSMAQQPVGPQREQAIKAAHEALFDTNQAMLRLPVDYRVGASSSTQARGGTAARMPEGHTYEHTMQQLKIASDRLYSAIHSIAREPAGERRNQAIGEANEALIQTHRAMVWVYDPRLAGSAPQGTSAQAAASADARGSVSSRAGGGTTSATEAKAMNAKASAMAGGVGINSRAKLSNEAGPGHNVKMVFSLNTGNYVADVHVRVKDKAGKTVMDGIANGPWLYAQLPAGTYTATATYAGHSVTEQLTLGRSGQRTAIFRWPANVEQQAAAGVSPILGTGPQNEPPVAR